jgi:hypothetical protein
LALFSPQLDGLQQLMNSLDRRPSDVVTPFHHRSDFRLHSSKAGININSGHAGRDSWLTSLARDETAASVHIP